MTFRSSLTLICLILLAVVASCSKSKLTTLPERFTKEMNGTFNFKKRAWVSGEQIPPVDTTLDIVVIHDSLIKIGSMELPLVHGVLTYKGNTVWDDNLHYMLFGHDDTSGMVVVKYFYGTSTLDIEDVQGSTTTKFTHIK